MRFALLSAFVLLFVALASAKQYDHHYQYKRSENCPQYCTKEYRPVCGKNEEGDHKTFSNECEFHSYNCQHPDSQYEFFHTGACEQSKRSPCPAFCPMIWYPVCGRNDHGHHRSFSNECELHRYNCQNPESGYVKVRPGRC